MLYTLKHYIHYINITLNITTNSYMVLLTNTLTVKKVTETKLN